MDINKMKSVLAVAQTHSFSEAAAELPLAQSSVSKHIASVEDELGITLFTRSRNSKSVELTGDGEIFVKYAREIVDDYDAMCRDLQAAGQKTTLVVRTIPMPGVFSRSELLSHFLGRDSNIELKLETKKSREVLPALLNKQIDAAVFRPFFENGVALSPDSLLYDARLDVFEICDNPALIAVAPNHPLADRDSLELIDLIGEKSLCRGRTNPFPVMTRYAVTCL